MICKSIHELVIEDFDKNTIWIITDYDVGDGVDSQVVPRTNYTIDDLLKNDCWVGINGIMSDGMQFKGISLLDFENKNLMNHSFYINDCWHSLISKPAPDFVLEKEGPIPFAKMLNKKINEVFPIIISTELKIDDELEKVTISINS